MTRHSLYWELRAHKARHDLLAKQALAADDTVAFLDRARREPWRRFEDRQRAAEWLTDHLWPDEQTRPVWHSHYIRNVYEQKAHEYMGTYKPPTDDEGKVLDGYHFGGVWFPEIARAYPLQCPECGNEESFWDFDKVDAGEAHEPELRCPCGWEPPRVEG